MQIEFEKFTGQQCLAGHTLQLLFWLKIYFCLKDSCII